MTQRTSPDQIRQNYYRIEVPEEYLHPIGYETDLSNVAVECQGVIEAMDMNFNLGNAMKYLWRSGDKDGVDRQEDLQKALTYLQFELDRLEREIP